MICVDLRLDEFFCHPTKNKTELVKCVKCRMSLCAVFAATGSQNKRQLNYADGSVLPLNRRNVMQQDMIKQQHHQTDMIQQQRREDIYSSSSSSPDPFCRPSSALRNCPNVYALFSSI